MLQPSLLMGGQAATATGGASFDRHNPLDGQVATRAPAATPDDARAPSMPQPWPSPPGCHRSGERRAC